MRNYTKKEYGPGRFRDDALRQSSPAAFLEDSASSWRRFKRRASFDHTFCMIFRAVSRASPAYRQDAGFSPR